MVDTLSWKPEFSVGIKEFDDHHRTMLEMINKLLVAIDRGEVPAVIDEIIDQLVKYTNFHFTAEEVLMEETSYPGFEEHRQAHVDLTTQIIDFQAQMYAGVNINGGDLLEFMAQWLLVHIMGMDQDYTTHLRKYGRS